jgi:hypothetical protein
LRGGEAASLDFQEGVAAGPKVFLQAAAKWLPRCLPKRSEADLA